MRDKPLTVQTFIIWNSSNTVYLNYIECIAQAKASGGKTYYISALPILNV